jgi:hypothetical protein
MKKQKFNSITFHAAAQKIVDQYFGEIPDFELTTAVKVNTLTGITKNRFWIYYERSSFNKCDLGFLTIEDTPFLALDKFENSMMKFWEIPTPEETQELIDFDLPY